MKVAIIVPRKFIFDAKKPNSIETVIRTLNTESRFKNEIAVFADEGSEDHGSLNTITVSPQGGRRARNRRVVQKLKDFSPDLIEVHQNIQTAMHIAPHFKQTRTTIFRHNYIKENQSRIYLAFQAWRYNQCDSFVFVSEATRSNFTSVFPKYTSRTHVIRNAVPPEPWLGEIENKEKLIAFGGRAADEKGFAEFCASLPSILRDNPEWNVEICALDWKKHEAWSESQVEPLTEFGPRITLRKDQPVASVQDMLKRAAIAVIPSKFEEPFGLAALEAHLAGAALISSGSGGLREVSGEHAHYLDHVTSADISSALQNLIDNPDQRIMLAKKAQQHSLAHHSVEKRTAELDDLREEFFQNRL